MLLLCRNCGYIMESNIEEVLEEYSYDYIFNSRPLNPNDIIKYIEEVCSDDIEFLNILLNKIKDVDWNGLKESAIKAYSMKVANKL